MHLLEEEVVGNQLILNGLVHALKRVEGTLEVTGQGVESLNDCVHDIESLLLGKSGSEGEVSEVSADSDSCGNDHGGIFRCKGGSVQLGCVHV